MLSAPGMRPFAQPPVKRRRTATGVLAGYFDARPQRDVLTDLLTNVGRYIPVEGVEDERRLKKRERKEQERKERKMKKLQERAERPEHPEAIRKPVVTSQPAAGPSVVTAIASGRVPIVNSSTSSFWRTQGVPVLATRSVSPTPPPELSPPSTPEPSTTSSMSYDSSKRPHTPEDDLILEYHLMLASELLPARKERKKREAARKGWKGWVEGSPPPSDKLINLDSAPVMVERRTRSGKNFDAISEGTDTWVKLGMFA